MGTKQSHRAPPVLLPHSFVGGTGRTRHPKDGKGRPSVHHHQHCLPGPIPAGCSLPKGQWSVIVDQPTRGLSTALLREKGKKSNLVMVTQHWGSWSSTNIFFLPRMNESFQCPINNMETGEKLWSP